MLQVTNYIVAFGKDRLNDNELKSMFLLLGGQGFDFEDATYSALVSTYEHTYTWAHDPLFGWTTGQTVAVKILGDPVIAIEAVTTTVEYGGNNNAAESTAEFRFTRYGITENEQSFKRDVTAAYSPPAQRPLDAQVHCRAIEFQQLSLGR